MIEKVVNIPINDQNAIPGYLIIPDKSNSIVIFAHGSGSTASSNRNQMLGEALNKNGFSTLLFDLLTEGEKQIDNKVQKAKLKVPAIILNKFNIELLTERLLSATMWVQENKELQKMEIGYFGASTGAAASLIAAGSIPSIKVVICRSGRSDLVDKERLSDIKCPCFFIAGQNDKEVIEINKKTIARLKNTKNKKIEIIAGASHLFEEDGKIEIVTNISIRLFKAFLAR